jgi:hypothetical protein
MNQTVTEALLEMVYYQPLKTLFERHYGRQFLNLYKPSARKEVLLGYDQAWVRTELEQGQFESRLSEAIAANTGFEGIFYVAYLLQFKCVKAVHRMRDENAKASGLSSPCFRSELSLEIKPGRPHSQHSILMRLYASGLKEVYYACPMVFCSDDINSPDLLGLLRVVGLAKAKDYISTERHFIYFPNAKGDTPFWCSQPVPATAVTAAAWADERGPVPFPGLKSPKQMADWLQRLKATVPREQDSALERPWLLPSLTIWEFGPSKSVRP